MAGEGTEAEHTRNAAGASRLGRAGRFVRQGGSLALLVGFVVWGGWYLWSHAGQLRELRFLAPLDVAIVVALHILGTVCEGALTRLAVRPFGVRLPLGEATALAFASKLANQFVPMRGGLGLRAVHLKLRHGLAYAHFASTAAGVYVIGYLVSATLGLGALAGSHQLHGVTSRPLAVAFAAIFVVLLALALPRSIPDVKWRPFRPFAQALEGWSRLRREPGIVLALTVLSVVAALASAAALSVCFRATGVPLPLLGGVLAMAAVGSFSFLALTPGAVGFAEAAIVVATRPFGVEVAHAVAVSLVYRLTIYVAALPTGLVASAVLWGRGAVRRLVEVANR